MSEKNKMTILDKLHILETKEGKYHIAHCLEYDIVSQGTTPKKAKNNLFDLISSYLHFGIENDIQQFAYYPAPKVYWDKFKKRRRKISKLTLLFVLFAIWF